MPRKKATHERVHPALPKPDQAVVDAIEKHLLTSYDMKRPPLIAAAVLAMIVDLSRLGQAFPEREYLAKFLNCSKFGIDAAISTALARREITMTIGIEPGKIAARDSVVKYRYFHPSEELVSVARRARRRAA